MRAPSRLPAALLAMACLAGPPCARAAEVGDVTLTYNFGTSLYAHRFAALGKTAGDTTIADTFGLSEFLGAGVFVTPRLRLGLNVQFTEAITEPAEPYPSRFAVFALLPQFNYNFWGPLTASFVPGVLLRLNGTNQMGFVPQAVLTAAVPLGAGFSALFSVEVPVMVYPIVSVGITPLVGVGYRVPRARPKIAPSEVAPAPPPSAG